MRERRQPSALNGAGGTLMRRRPDALISRRNWHDTREYLDYCAEVKQTTVGTVSVYRGALDLVLDWARDCPLPACDQLRPTFAAWLAERDLAISYQTKTCSVCRNYLVWAKTHWDRYTGLSIDAVNAIRPARGADAVHELEIYTLENVRAITALRPDNLTERRDIAAVAFLFLSGMRAGAFASLPIAAVDLDHWMIMQWPSLGVRTKNSKAANTYLLAIEDLREVVLGWDELVREQLPAKAPWYALIDQSGRAFAADQTPGERRGIGLNQRLRALCIRAGVAYRSCHKLRHGHAVFALSRVRTMDEFKAVSQNLMHNAMQTTDTIYAELLDDQVGSVITRLTDTPNRDDHVLRLVRELIARIDSGAIP